MTQRFTGWHMAAVLVAFFGVVVTVNVIMARFAIGTFGGTVVENSYVASQNYNRWLAAADRQAKLGWAPEVKLDAAQHINVTIMKDAMPLTNMRASGTAIHPLGRTPSVALTFKSEASGALRSNETLPPGRWHIRLSLRRGADELKLQQPIR